MVGEATDGLDAIEVVAQEQAEVVLLDWWLPRADGLAALPELRVRARKGRRQKRLTD